MQIEYYDSQIQKAKIATNAAGMVIVGSVMVVAGLSILQNLLSKKAYWR